MKFDRLVRPSDQVDIIIPEWIREQYPRFVEFMTNALQAEERQGFAADILQNMLKYRDFDYYKGEIVFEDVLNQRIDENIDDEIILNDAEGFPKENGVVQIDSELILYRKREGKKLLELQRGSSGTVYLGTFVRDSDYVYSVPQPHAAGTSVYNLSALFLRSFLKTIHETFVTGIDPDWVDEGINRGTLLERIRDFFQSKGTKLGIKSLFKILFGENDVDVHYPGDRMIVPSKSTYNETNILRTVPIPEILVNLNSYIPPSRLVQTGTALRGNTVYDDRTEIVVRSLNTPYEVAIVSPEKLINKEIVLKSYNDIENEETDGRIYGRAICDYVTSYQYGDETQYELYVQKKTVEGNFVSNPSSFLTRTLKGAGSADDRFDVTTVTVESTIGFPESGVIFIAGEGIQYDGITFNQFLNCRRGYIGLEDYHYEGDAVRGPFFIEGTYTVQDERGRLYSYTSRSWPLGLVDKVEIHDPGILHEKTDQITAGTPGNIDPREPALASFQENYNDQLISQAALMPSMQDVEKYTAGISGIYYDKEYIFATSTNFPLFEDRDEEIGLFSSDDSVGPTINVPNALHVIPRNTNIRENDNGEGRKIFTHKGMGPIGLCINGAPFYSNVSNQRVLSGVITRYEIVHTGYGYEKPTVLVDDIELDETIEIGELGRVLSITATDTTEYTGIVTLPRVEVTGGKGGELTVDLDEYGRVINVNIVNGGQYYNTPPSIVLNDKSKQGKGALLAAKVENGTISSVEIINSGIDYNRSPDVVVVVVTPRGQDCQVVPVVQYYQVNRWGEVNFHSTWTFDPSGGFLWEFKQPSYNFDRATTAVEKINYGYIYHPTSEGFDYTTPQLIGYAYDGCPIYSPTLYSNGKDDTDGYKYAFSGYVTRPNRETVSPGGGGEPTAPPSVADYPMGTFIEDYEFNPDAVIEYITNLDPIVILPFAEFDGTRVAVLNENNAIKMNTPEYPAELYPDGVWCYIATVNVEDGKPEYPYVIGETFEKRPMTQRTSQILREDPQAIPYIIYNPNSNNLESPITFDYEVLERYHNPYLPDTNDELVLEIEQTSRGFVSGVEIVDGLPNTTKVGDYLYFDNENTGGSGASGIVSEIKGAPVVRGYTDRTETYFQSHLQQLNVGTSVYDPILHDDPLLEPGTKWKAYHFIEGQIITTSSKAEATVIYWDYERSLLYVDTYTKNLIVAGDAFRDIKNRWVKLASGLNVIPSLNYYTLNDVRTDRNILAFSDIEPEATQPGDLWWSNNTGRLYIYYKDNDSSQWVATQPITMLPISGSLDIGTGALGVPTSTTFTNQPDNKVIISNKAPLERLNGDILRIGDMWWSPHTGFLSIFVQGQWVCTDPNAIVPTESADDNPVEWDDDILSIAYESQQYVIISAGAPDSSPDLEPGLLWWSPKNGKMFIYFQDEDGTTAWIQTNPVGRMSSSVGLDEIIVGDGGGDGSKPPTFPLPLPDGDGDGVIAKYFDKDEIILWFDHLKYFSPGQKIAVQAGGPNDVEIMTIEEIVVTGAPAAARVRRGQERKSINDGSLAWNDSVYRYIVETEYAHKLRIEDTITIEGSEYEWLNQTHSLNDVGVVENATATATISNGEVTGATVVTGGLGYTADFEVYFYGGNGYRGTGIAEVNIADGGVVTNIRITDPGYGYTEAPNVWFGNVIEQNEFMFYTDKFYREETDISFKTDSLVLEGPAATIEMLYGGQGYIRMPKILGTYHKSVDRGQFKVNLEYQTGTDGEGLPIYSQGTSITSVDVILQGSRYRNPRALFIDLAGNGYGASANLTVVAGKVTAIDITNGGIDYQEPYLLLIEDSGKYIGLTETIGQIKDISIINPGRSISTNETINPLIQIDTRVIVKFDLYIRASLLSPDGYIPTKLMGTDGHNNAVIDPNVPINEFDNFNEGDMVWQGTEDGSTKVCTATVIDYDSERQIITLRNVSGQLKENEYLYGEFGEKGYVLREGQADVRTDVHGMSRPKGRFIDDTSMPSTRFANIQDSYYFQHFSYSISSPLQQTQYDDFVSRIIHPAGMIMFSDVTVRSNVQNVITVVEPIVAGPVVPILSPDAYNTQYTAFAVIPAKTEGINDAIGPNMGTTEFTD